MNSEAGRNTHNVLKIVQTLLDDTADRSAISPEIISLEIDRALAMRPAWAEGLDREFVTHELIRRFGEWIGGDSVLSSETDHEPWLVASRKADWRYWQRYSEWLEERLGPTAVEALDTSTDSILGLLEDPARAGSWDRRGLVVGHVQSGKTGHYTGLICKAADAGYKIVIVLAGLHNNLRSQTQMRLDEGFLGYETSPLKDDLRVIGVGEVDSDLGIRPNYATNRTEKGDFTAGVARNLGVSPEQRPWLFVVKKNKTVLERLLRWIRNHVADSVDRGSNQRKVTKLPLLVIDDEADHASVDTGDQLIREDGTPDEEHQPTAINRLIRRILYSFSRSAYVGYTATPFANIFIHEQGFTREEGPDLFPAAFISNLAASSNYIGPARVFGRSGEDGREGGINLIREVSDYASADGTLGWMPHRHKSTHIPLFGGEDQPPPSLVEAIHAFLLSCAVRALRGQGAEHCSMLVHVTRFNAVQTCVHRQVDDVVRRVRQRLARGVGARELEADLRALWEREFISTNQELLASHPALVTSRLPSWADVFALLPETAADIQVRRINGTAKDALDYADRQGAGLKVIAIGGDKLARGLTLEGLCVSYFLRASRMYDTLMQMGRWFGYRPGYLDVCRLYTTGELTEWFEHIADAAEELREEFDIMSSVGGTPKDYGLKVQSHPVLMVTSRVKMRTARNLMLSFSGELLETTALHRDPERLRANVLAVKRLVDALGSPKKDPVRHRNGKRDAWAGSFFWDECSAEVVIDFLSAYQTHPDAYKVDSALLREFVESMSRSGELTSWAVVLIGGGEGQNYKLTAGVTVDMLKRKMKTGYETRYSIGRLMSPRDEAIDLDESEWNAALQLTRSAWRNDPARGDAGSEPKVPNGPAIRRVRGLGADGVKPHPERGVLFLYLLDPAVAEAGFDESTPPIAAIAVSFPVSRSGTKVKYAVNTVLWEQEYGVAE